LIDDVIARVLLYIKDMGLTAGQKLPPERVLADEIGLNRTSLREGLAVMEYMRYIDRRQGSGAYLLDSNQGSFEGSILLLLQQDGISINEAEEVYEAVVMIESVIGKLAAEKHTLEDIHRLESLNHEIAHLIQQGKNTYQLDVDFHRQLALMSKNTFLIQISTAFWLRLVGYARAVQEQPAQAQDLLQHHQQLVKAIKAGNGMQAEMIVKDHYRYSMDFIKGYFKN